ncbi:translational GTPase TypA [Spiroplasma endosymbiont of Virgichneumon dumeticola]|uniref:translational GTPase TypA n=1 Tax=Spiroplasma endosymbiont of Virgichneumon dumeticola TaxID=3139323 RepID=UPI0035C8B1D4
MSEQEKLVADQKIINIAVIAHVDVGKSTLVDALLKQSGVFRQNQVVVEQVMDSNEQERRRGITIYAKNCSIMHGDVKINIVDTPGHADFSSEVERIMKTVDCVILLVDSVEGPMPQTRFVLQKALEHNLNPILMINKIDKKDQRIDEVKDEVLNLFMELNANDTQLDFPTLYGITRQGICQYELDKPSDNLEPLFETIIKHAKVSTLIKINKPLQMQISSLDYDSFIGRIGIGRIFQGTISENQEIVVVDDYDLKRKARIKYLFVYQGLKRIAVKTAIAGDIVCVAGIENITIGNTICDKDNVNPMDPITIQAPTMSMNFLVNNSPFCGTEGKLVTSNKIQERLTRELETNVGLKVEQLAGSNADGFKVFGRGELHLSVLIENMRQEGFELGISKPEVVFKKDEKGHTTEPVEEITLNHPTEYSSTIIDNLNRRKGIITNMDSDNVRDKIVFHIPTRGLIGFGRQYINITRGTGVMVRSFLAYEPLKGEIGHSRNGVLVSMVTGITLPYALNSLEERGTLFVKPQTKVYEGMIIGLSSRDKDLDVNPCKAKQLTNTRSSGNDEAVRLTPPILFSLEEALEFVDNDELVEVTPENIRMRKRFLTENERKKNRNRK